jgi:hypothetical protein
LVPLKFCLLVWPFLFFSLSPSLLYSFFETISCFVPSDWSQTGCSPSASTSRVLIFQAYANYTWWIYFIKPCFHFSWNKFTPQMLRKFTTFSFSFINVTLAILLSFVTPQDFVLHVGFSTVVWNPQLFSFQIFVFAICSSFLSNKSPDSTERNVSF